jgi:hypothetical protein
MLMLAEVAAAEDKLDREALQPPSPIEKAIDPTSGIGPPPHRTWNPSADPRPDLVPFMRTVEEVTGICSVRISVRNVGDSRVPEVNLVDSTEAREARTLLKTYWQVEMGPDDVREDERWISQFPGHLNLRWGHRVTGEAIAIYIEAGVCLPGQFVVDIRGALLEANEANVTPPALLLCCD